MDTTFEPLNWVLDLWSSLTSQSESFEGIHSGNFRIFQQTLVPRTSIFDHLSLDNGVIRSGRHFIPVHQDGISYPIEESLGFASALRLLVNQVTQQIESLTGDGKSVLQQIFAIFDHNLEGVAIATNGEESSAVPFPLYIRLQTALRLASRQGKVQLVYGDLSGIQKYIFDVSRLGVTGVAKKLRARSLRISLLTRLFADYLCASHGGSHLQICMSAGGVFYLLLPPDVDALPITDAVNRWLLDEYHCAISFHVGSKVCSVDEVETEFSRVAEEVIDGARLRKERAFHQTLIQNGEWVPDSFVIRHEPLGDRCAHCQRHPIHQNGLCTMCNKDEQLGSRLPRTKWLRFRNDGNGDIAFADRVSVDLLSAYPSETLSTEYALYGLDMAKNVHPGVPMMFMNTHVPIADEDCPHCATAGTEGRVRKGDVYTFGCISALGEKSDEPLGYLKADVDSMGLLFALGFVYDKKSSATLYEYATLSQSLDRFFTYRLQQLLQQERPQIYSVFSGGDDLYLIGRASDILAFSLRLEEEFSKYVLHPEVTISTGVAFVKSRKPLSRVTSEVEEFLEEAKESPGWARQCIGFGGRNQVTFHGRSFTWDEFRLLLSEAETLVTWMNQNLLTSGVLYRLNTAIGELPRDVSGFINREDLSVWRLLPRLFYEMSRNLKDVKYQPVVQWIEANCYISNDWSDGDWLILQSWPAFIFLIQLLKGDKKS